ncbi:MAG: benzoyl-CoA 2,3-epoxidase subunit BoxB [Candidatus Binataceae bacterium]
MMPIDYSERIPNNVNLNGNRRLQRALEEWQPRFLNWWRELGPTGSQATEVYLRTAVSANADGWAIFDHVRMPDYRWGIFLADAEAGRTIGFGAHRGAPVWTDLPGEYRGMLRRLIVTQGDTEPASVEQQRHLGATAPSLYDLRNLFQINVEEARHLWAMVYLLHAYFGRDGREEAEALLQRHSGDAERPRILGAFNEPTPDWLAFFMFTYFTDRDGKYQLASLAESGFDPLARTCRFMLTEEAHHLFVGEMGVARVVARTCALMREHRTANVGAYGGVELALLQKYLNFHYAVSLDLFGSELSTNAANYFTAGLKGRFRESDRADDHQLSDQKYEIPRAAGDELVKEEQPALLALNEILRDDYVADSTRGVARWNRIIKEAGIDFALTLPHRGFNRRIGEFANLSLTPDGRIVAREEWNADVGNWLPAPAERDFVASLMRPATRPAEFSSWIAPPARGINHQAPDFAYVRLDPTNCAKPSVALRR